MAFTQYAHPGRSSWKSRPAIFPAAVMAVWGPVLRATGQRPEAHPSRLDRDPDGDRGARSTERWCSPLEERITALSSARPDRLHAFTHLPRPFTGGDTGDQNEGRSRARFDFRRNGRGTGTTPPPVPDDSSRPPLQSIRRAGASLRLEPHLPRRLEGRWLDRPGLGRKGYNRCCREEVLTAATVTSIWPTSATAPTSIRRPPASSGRPRSTSSSGEMKFDRRDPGQLWESTRASIFHNIWHDGRSRIPGEDAQPFERRGL